LQRAEVLYAPDFVVNAGGVINIAEELIGYHRERAYAAIRQIFDTTARVLEIAAREGITTARAADRMAEHRIAELSHIGLRTFRGTGR
jgi:leucine dehydrogenase